MNKKLPILPNSPSRRVNERIVPQLPGSEPTLPEDQINRGNQISPDITNSISIEDIDDSIFYYFREVIKPQVIQNGVLISVPVQYASQERWVSAQKNGYYRDKNGKLMYPLIVIRKTGFEKNRNLSNKLDGNDINNYVVSKSRYNSKNQYTPFNVLNNYIPSEKMYITPIPDYVNLTYECSVYTNYIHENNKIIEAIEFASDSYWGDKDRFQFRAFIDRFNGTNEYSDNEERIVKTSMDLTLYGYILPDSLNRDKAASGKKQFYSKSVVNIVNETVTNK